MIAIVDYGMANLRSVEKAFLQVGGDPVVTSDPKVVTEADKVVLPGVGAFCAAMSNLHRSGLHEAVLEFLHSGRPFLGICLGLQMLFEESSEMGATAGLGVLPGRVVKFFENESASLIAGGITSPAEGRSTQEEERDKSRPHGREKFEGLKVPHIGWNSLHFPRESRLLHGLDEGARVYFVHSYYPEPVDSGLIAATSDYGVDFCCAIEKDNIAATQFHPEKSGAVGLQILRNFVAWN
jgi:imidazole glycerol-phosphate synthase subunit HisH